MDPTQDPKPAVEDENGAVESETGLPSSIDPKASCPVYNTRGECRSGFKCRFLGDHVRKDDDGSIQLVSDEKRVEESKDSEAELNFLPGESLKLLRTKKVCVYPAFAFSRYLAKLHLSAFFFSILNL